MGNEKRLFLLAVMTVLMSTAGYGTLYPDQNNETEVNKDEIIKQEMLTDNHKESNTVISVGAGKYAVIDKKVNLELINTNKNVSKKIINITGDGTDSNGKKIETINNGNIVGINNGGKGFEIISMKGGNFKNEGLLSISGTNGKGINITGAGVNAVNTKNIVSSNGATGVYIKEQSNFTNNGIIETTGTNSKGVEIGNNGDVENSKEIIAGDGAIGVLINGDNAQFTNTASGKIIASGVNTDGVRLEKGTFINNGTIEVKGSKKTSGKSEASGVKIKGSSSFDNTGIIKVTGTIKEGDSAYSGYQSKGINIDNKDASATNSNLIDVDKRGIGVATKGKFTNNNLIKANDQSIGINIIDSGNAINNKNILADNKSYGVQVAVKGTFTNEKDGYIEVKNGSTGIIAAKGTSKAYTKIENAGNIFVSGGSSTGMQANDYRKVSNTGNIYVEAARFTSGIKATGTSSLGENTGNLIIVGDGTNTANGMIAQNGGEVLNNGISKEELALVSASGKSTSAMSSSGDKSKAKNGENGVIEVFNDATGMKIEKGASGENSGVINVVKGTGVTVNDSIFINSGEINAGETGIAIQSLGKNNNTVYLKDGSKIKGRILGAEGVDVLTLGTGSYSGLNVNKYEALTTRGGGNINVSNSTIALEYSEKTKEYLTTSKEKLDTADGKNDKKGNLSLSNSNLIIDIKNQNVDGINDNLGTMIDVGDTGKVSFDNVKFGFNSSNGEKAFNVSDILNDATNGKMDNNALDYLGSNSTAIWTYSKDKDGDWIASKKTFGEASKSQVSEFAQFLDNGKLSSYTNEMQFLSQGAFDKGMAQLSGGLHGYSADIAAVSSRTLSNTMKERALTRDYLIKRPVSSWTQDVMYIDNNHRFGGLMDVDYNEKGVLGISEKQILPNGRVGLVYGGSSGTADAGESGSIKVDTAYFGGYYNHEFNDKWSLNSNANFVYNHDRVTRNVKIGNLSQETFKSNYPLYTVGLGSSLIYTVKDDLYNKAHFYAGVDVNRIIQGTINEEEDTKYADSSDLAIRKKGAVNDKSYYSIVPSAGFMVQNTGYIFDKKYRIGADLNWETEVGNIKDGKRLHMKGLPTEYKVETTERENIFSYSLFGALNLTEDLAVNAKYTSMFSDEYDADMVSAGFEYKMDTMGDNGIFAPLFYGIENHKPISDRWAGTFSLLLENEDDSDRTYYVDTTGRLVGGDYATSNQYKPKFTLSLNDKKSDWSYYFEGYLKSNHLVKTPKGNEEEQDAMRLHGEARWSDTYSKGKYGFNIGYRHEQSDKPYLSYYEKAATRAERGVHQLRLVPNFTYELGNGFTFGGGTTGIFEYNYKGQREGEMDFLMENQYGITYTGFMPKWKIVVNYFREDRWLDHDNTKLGWNTSKKEYTYSAGPARYQLNQIRPSITYYFGNGGSFKFDARIPFGNGAWYNSLDEDKKDAENYEVRYGFTYYHPVTPGLTMSVGGIFVTTKTKVKDHNKPEYGDINRSYSFRPNIGFSYSF